MGSTAVRKVTTGEALVDQAVIDTRLAICQACPHYDEINEGCKLCTCSANRKKQMDNKLSHASSVCPLNPPKWGAVE